MGLYEELFYGALRIRMVEEKIVEIYPTDKIQSPVHLSIGQEHHVVAICAALNKKDQFFTTYRNHASYLAKGGDLKLMFAELFGKSTGIAKGKAGSMHLCFPAAGLMGSSAIVGSIFSHALGSSYATILKKDKRIVVAMAGDGATEEGAFHESMNFASLKRLPLLFIIENNGLAIHSHISDRQSYDIGELSRAYKIEVCVINDGFDMSSIYEKVKNIRELIIKKQRPFLLEIKTYRYKEHVGINDDYDCGYRNRKDFKKWYDRDPLVINRELIARFKNKIEEEIQEAVTFAENSSFPDRQDLLREVF